MGHVHNLNLGISAIGIGEQGERLPGWRKVETRLARHCRLLRDGSKMREELLLCAFHTAFSYLFRLFRSLRLFETLKEYLSE
jgi:hypothetical protein